MHDLARWIGTWFFRPVYRLRVHHRDRVPAQGPVVRGRQPQRVRRRSPAASGCSGGARCSWSSRRCSTGRSAWALPRIGQLAVRRGAPDRRPLTQALAVLRGGGLVAVFPEGTRTDGEVAAAQHGAAWLARTGGAVVLPVVCRGTRRTAGARRRFRPRVDVLVGEPLTLAAGGGRAGLAAATETIRAALAGLVADLDELRRTT